jgi:predicted Zn-dependent protease
MFSLRLLAWTAGFCLLLAGCVVNPVTGERQFMLLPESQDVEIGRTYAPEIEKQTGGRIENHVLQSYINGVGRKIGAVSHRPDLQFQFIAVNDESVNAFALPGGYVFVTKGMLKQLNSEAQLAGILAHETVHIVARHAAEAISWQIGTELLLSAATSDKTGQGVITTANLALQLLSLSFSRQDEREADLAGVDYMVSAGYDPHGMLQTMQILEQQNSIRLIQFLSSHPSPADRARLITEKIQTSYYPLASLKSGEQDYRKYVLEQLP